MRTRKQGMFERIRRLQHELMVHKPSYDDMKKEIQTMRYKVSPKGAAKTMNFSSPLIVELLWYIGKVDACFSPDFHTFTRQEQQAVEHFVHSLWEKLYDNLDSSDLAYALSFTQDDDIEVYKEQPILLN